MPWASPPLVRTAIRFVAIPFYLTPDVDKLQTIIVLRGWLSKPCIFEGGFEIHLRLFCFSVSTNFATDLPCGHAVTDTCASICLCKSCAWCSAGVGADFLKDSRPLCSFVV